MVSPQGAHSNEGIMAGAFGGKWSGPLLTDTYPLARGQWSTPTDDPHFHSGYRRYAASKLCEVTFM